MTSQLQVLNALMNKQLYGERLLGGDHALTQTAIIKKTSITLLHQWIITAWQHISLMKRFKKCCIPNAIDRCNDNTWNSWEGNHH
jgi:hypothetical protein